LSASGFCNTATFDAGDIVQEGDGVEAVQGALAVALILRHSVLVGETGGIPAMQRQQQN
jgi:hypothetical protein